MLITSFEDIEVWRVSRGLVKTVYQLTYNQSFHKDYALKDQIRRSAISIMANIAEGFERRSNKEFIQFLRYSVHPQQRRKAIFI
ncbi:MAG: four helix bundle protein [Candidatus Hatepunaea meridiana]|nr:four helix bundle protein [Candidatus Hatepunaea meridiana]